MDAYFAVKALHIISSAVLFGTGLGIAFFMFCAHYAQNIHEKYYAARFTVLADYVFTAPAVVWIQIQMRKTMAECSASGTEPPERYHRLFRLWFCLGWPAFLSLIIIFYLMVAKPV